jgi:hypothetical protein
LTIVKDFIMVLPCILGPGIVLGRSNRDVFVEFIPMDTLDTFTNGWASTQPWQSRSNGLKRRARGKTQERIVIIRSGEEVHVVDNRQRSVDTVGHAIPVSTLSFYASGVLLRRLFSLLRHLDGNFLPFFALGVIPRFVFCKRSAFVIDL